MALLLSFISPNFCFGTKKPCTIRTGKRKMHILYLLLGIVEKLITAKAVKTKNIYYIIKYMITT